MLSWTLRRTSLRPWSLRCIWQGSRNPRRIHTFGCPTPCCHQTLRGELEFGRMDLRFEARLAKSYASSSQKIRVLSEHWVGTQIFCPSCGKRGISQHVNNRPVADFSCRDCREEYELKSQKSKFGKRVADGAYATMIERLRADDNPNLLLLRYDVSQFVVRNLVVAPKQFFTHEVIEKRKPLSPKARRAGWVGCNILLQHIPLSGRIDLVRDGMIIPKADVLASWKTMLFLREKDAGPRGWLLSMMRCVEQIARRTFSLGDVYAFVGCIETAVSKEPAHQSEDASAGPDIARSRLPGISWRRRVPSLGLEGMSSAHSG